LQILSSGSFVTVAVTMGVYLGVSGFKPPKWNRSCYESLKCIK